MPKEWEIQLPASATAQLIHIRISLEEVVLSLVGAEETPGCTGEQIEEAVALAKGKKKGKLWKGKALKPTKLTASSLLEQAQEHYCGSVQMPGHLDEHLDDLDGSQSFDY